MSAKASYKKQEEIVVVRDFHEVFPDDLSGFPPIREIEFQIELIPEATPVAKSPYHLAPFELEELQDNSRNSKTKEIIEDGNSFKPVARTTTNADGTSTSTIPGAVTAEEKIQKKNDLKAWSILMMTLPNLGSISFDDLYNNFKIVEQEVKRSVISSLNSSSQNMAFVSTPSSTNDVDTSNIHVSTASSSLSTASSTDNTARPSDATIYAFLANQPNGSQRTGKKIIINGSDTVGYDKTKVECLNCHKMGNFARECKNPKSQDNRSRNQDSSRRTMNVEESSSKAMLAIDGAGFDWSFMTKEEVPTNFALMAFSDSELNKSEFDLANYKRGLAFVEEQLVFYKKNEGMLCDQISILKIDASFNESEINALKIQIERLKKEKESNQIKIDNFENASKSLDKLIGCQISDKNRKGVRYNAVTPPPTGLFAPHTIDLSNSDLEEFKQHEFEGYRVKVNKSVSENSSNKIKKTSGATIIEDWVSDCDEDETLEKVSESANVQKPKQADQPRKISQNHRNNSTNWNTPMSKKLGVGFQFTLKACFVCRSFNHLIKDCDFHDKKLVQKPILNNVKKGTGQREVRPVWNNAMRTNHQNFSNSRSNFAPTAVLTKSGLVTISTARQSSSRAAAPVSTARPIKTAVPKHFVNIVNYINIAKGKRVISAVGEQGINAVKSTACWVWRPKIKVLDHVSKNNGSYICKQFDYVDPTGLEFKDKKELAIPGQTATGKEFSNPLMADILTSIHGLCINMDPHEFSHVYLVLSSVFVMNRGMLLHGYWRKKLILVGDEAVHKELGDRMERAATTASSFKTEQDSGSGPRCQVTILGM
ncbi:ribonuclease H-like domain-containing protein [Tanacetum coccineum]